MPSAFLRTLKVAGAKLARFPRPLRRSAHARGAQPLRVRRRVTAPMHGFRDAADYWRRASSKPWLGGIRLPALVLNANDPFLPRGPARRAKVSATVTLDYPGTGRPCRLRLSGRSPAVSAGCRSGCWRISTPYGNPPSHDGAIMLHPCSSRGDAMQIPAPEIFKAYDIRGIVGSTLTPEPSSRSAAPSAPKPRERVKTVVVGRDGRLSGPELSQALMEGLCASGVDVADIGMVPTPLGYFAAHHLKTGSAVMVTGSHNPPDYNGFKIMLGGETLHSTAIRRCARASPSADYCHGQRQVSGRWMCARTTSTASSATSSCRGR
jgi:hypothetical protein